MADRGIQGFNSGIRDSRIRNWSILKSKIPVAERLSGTWYLRWSPRVLCGSSDPEPVEACPELVEGGSGRETDFHGFVIGSF
jgi:hypothetical protein